MIRFLDFHVPSKHLGWRDKASWYSCPKNNFKLKRSGFLIFMSPFIDLSWRHNASWFSCSQALFKFQRKASWFSCPQESLQVEEIMLLDFYVPSIISSWRDKASWFFDPKMHTAPHTCICWRKEEKKSLLLRILVLGQCVRKP